MLEIALAYDAKYSLPEAMHSPNALLPEYITACQGTCSQYWANTDAAVLPSL